MDGLATHQPQARSQRKGVAGNRLRKAKGRRNGNFKCRGYRIDTVAVISPRERDLVTAAKERTCDALRTRPGSTHLRAGQHGDDKDFHGLRVRPEAWSFSPRGLAALVALQFQPHVHELLVARRRGMVAPGVAPVFLEARATVKRHRPFVIRHHFEFKLGVARLPSTVNARIH